MSASLSFKNALDTLYGRHPDLNIVLGLRSYAIHKCLAMQFFSIDCSTSSVTLDVKCNPQQLQAVIDTLYGHSLRVEARDRDELILIAKVLGFHQLIAFLGQAYSGMPFTLPISNLDLPTSLLSFKYHRSTYFLNQLLHKSLPPLLDNKDLSDHFSVSEENFELFVKFLNFSSSVEFCNDNFLSFLALGVYFHCQPLVDSCCSYYLKCFSSHLIFNFIKSCTLTELKCLLETPVFKYLPTFNLDPFHLPC
ncbi:hypothetical protein GEMRC1_013676 [Eukaryota sp. GEM-RC1]